MFAWRRRQPSSSSSSSATITATAASTSTSGAPHATPEFTPEAPASLSPADAWRSSEGADIGVTRVAVAGDAAAGRRAELLYEISLHFPALGRRWLVRRSYAEFAALHAALDAQHHALLQARKARLPRAARLSWESFRASMGADAAAAHKLLAKLNAYLHKLLELDAVHTSAAFRAFLSPRAGSLDVESVAPAAAADDDELATGLRRAASTDDMTPLVRRAGLLPALLRRKSRLADPQRSSPLALSAPPDALCAHVVRFGGAVTFTALGGLPVGLTRRGALSGSHKAAAVAAGVAGVALTGPLSAVLALGALGGGVGKYQMNKALYVSVHKPPAVTAATLGRVRTTRSLSPSSSSSSISSSESATTDAVAPAGGEGVGGASFVVENAETFSGPRRAVQFGDLVRLYCPGERKSVRIAQPPNSKRGHLMVSSAESRTATLRLVSPYGAAGRIPCGSQVYLQVASSDWAGEFLGVHGGFLSSGKSPTVFKVSAALDHACGERGVERAAFLPPPASPPAPFRLRVMAYNVWLFPGLLTSFNGKLSPFSMHRARAIPACLHALDLDVVVFCEAFCSSAREALVAGMKERGFLYETRVVGAAASMASKKALDGGCFAMSKHPIDGFQELTFGSVASGDDRMADKGVVYCAIRVGSPATNVHVFGTHLQAWETPAAVATRASQLQLLREFIDYQEIPHDEAVLVVGDLNVNKSTDESSEYASMLDVLQVTEPDLVPHSPEFSFDPVTNALAVDGPSSSGETERLDYVLVAHQHRSPVRATAEIVRLKATSAWGAPEGGAAADETLVDLSDHYPVVGELHF